MKKSKILDAVHETASGLHKARAISNTTMREFDKACLHDVHDMTSESIKLLREQQKVSQSVFAAYLNISISTIKKWEIGAKKPCGAALKLLNLIERNGLDAVQ
jgi:putative transcriptional regulator